jgi:hypothetical protein
MNKKHLWSIGLLTAIIFLAIPVFHILKTKWNENDNMQPIPAGYANDASQLNLTKIDTIIEVANDQREIVNQLKAILYFAKENNLKISIAGAKHSMGGILFTPTE